MEKKKTAIVALAALATVLVLAGSAYAMSGPSTGNSPYSGTMMSGSGGGPMMGGSGGGQSMYQHMEQRMFQQKGNYSQPYAPHMMHQYANNYTHLYLHEYMWDYCNSTSAG